MVRCVLGHGSLWPRSWFVVASVTVRCGLAAGMVDTIFADVAQPDQARIVSINAHNYLKNQGHFVISIKVSLLSTIFWFAIEII